MSPNISSSRLKLSVKTSSLFDLVDVRDNTPILSTTTLLLQSSNTYQSSAFVELLSFGLVGANSTAVICEIGTDPSNSTFDIIFGYFGDSFLYYYPGTYLSLCSLLHILFISCFDSTVIACWTKSRTRWRRRRNGNHSCFSSNTRCILYCIHGDPWCAGISPAQLHTSKVEKRRYG